MGERTPSTGNSEIGAENSFLADLTSRLSQIMNQTPTAATQETLAAPIGIKLDDTNYGLWSQVVEMYISGKDKLGYINGDLPQPQETDPSFRKWRTENAVEDRVYTFLDGLDDRLDNIRGDVLQLKPFPTVEQAYAHVRREDLRQSVMLTKDDIVHSAVMISKGQKSQQQPSLQLASNGKQNFSTKPKSQGEEVGCTHCGHPKHTRDTCFKLYGYPEWWHDLKAKKKRDVGRAALMNIGDTSAAAYTEPQLSLIPQQGVLPATANTTRALDNPGNISWIIDSGATDHMTFDAQDFIETSQQKRTCIANANGVTYPVTGAGKVALSPSFTLSNTLLVPSLSNKLLSIGQVIEELNCCALMYPKFCLFQDLRNKKIIGRGTKREGLYYMDDLSIGQTNTAHGTNDKERQIWLWHYRLGHPSFSYLKHLFPNAVVASVYLINQMPSRVLNFKTPLQTLAHYRPLPSVLTLPPRIFGCVAYVHIHKTQRTKLDPCAVRCIFLGYGNHKKGYRCSDPSTRRLYTTMDVTFLEYEMFFSKSNYHSSLQGEKVCEEQNMWEGWPGFDSTTPAQCEEVTIDANKAAQLLSQDAPKTQSGVMKDDVTGSICGQEQSIQSTEEEHTLDSHVLPNSEVHTLEFNESVGYKLPFRHNHGKPPSRYSPDHKGNRTRYPIANYVWDDEQEITSLQEYLATEFEMKNLGGLKYFLGIEVSHSTQGIFLSQRKYVLDLLAETGMLECKPVDTPIVQNHGLREHQAQIPTNKERKHHHLDIDGYTDADWAGNATDRRSTSGYFTFVGGNLVTWRSKKQNVVALSSAEAEFRGMAKGLCELLWLKGLLAEIGYSSKSSMNMFCDNKSAIQIAENPVQHDRTKHVEVDRHFIKEKLEAKIIRFPFVKSEEQLADILTKAVSSKVFHNS
ncbi:hypothetical protein RJ639_015952 [Escallonia herrerae]|uniref:Polyprotein n=1 Tax=Escallonia herrerae TaxID=1293975 RepID=A0AA89AIU8_9ASTE|nr:hypothetical protein RJ639_015952 [Escallonia herrerae]